MCVELSSTSNIIISYNFPFLEAVVPTQVSSTIFHNWANRNHFSIHCVLVSAEVKEKTQHVSMQRPCSAISIGAPSNRLNPLKGGKGSLQSPWKWNLLKNHCTFLCIFFFSASVATNQHVLVLQYPCRLPRPSHLQFSRERENKSLMKMF